MRSLRPGQCDPGEDGADDGESGAGNDPRAEEAIAVENARRDREYLRQNEQGPDENRGATRPRWLLVRFFTHGPIMHRAGGVVRLD